MQETTNASAGLLRCALPVAVCLALLAFASPAQAAKGWAPKEVFGSAEQPSFANDANLAIRHSSGDLLVLDPASETLSRWHADGTPSEFSALATNVIAGVGGEQRDQVAVDDSGGATDGNIYVTGVGGLDVFSDAGESLGELTRCDAGAEFANTDGVAVDAAGDLYVSAGEIGGINKYEPAASPPVNADCTATLDDGEFPGIAGNLAAGAGPTAGHLFVAKRNAARVMRTDSGLEEAEFEFGSGLGRQLTLDPVTGHVLHKAESEIGIVEYDASGPDEESVDVISTLEDAGGQVDGLAVLEGAEELYIAYSGSETIELWEAVTAPEATVGPPSLVSGGKATVTGTVEPEGQEIAECVFEYGETTAYGNEAPCDPAAAEIPKDFGAHEVSGDLTGLLANGATYHYRLAIEGAGAKRLSEDEELTTADTYSTDPAGGVFETEATLNGTVKPEGVELTECRFAYGTAFLSASVPCDPEAESIPNTDSDVAVSAVLAGLAPATTYRFRLIAANALGQIVGEERTFTTRGRPIVEQQPIEVTQTSATLLARVNPAGSDTTYHFEWGEEAGQYGNRIPANFEGNAGEGTAPVIRTGLLSGLEPASTYHFRVLATNAFGTTTGPDQAFETLGANGLPDSRAYELVSPADKGPSGSVSPGVTPQHVPYGASGDGESFLYPIQNGIPGSSAGGWTRWLAQRGAAGWGSTQVSAPALIEPPEARGFVTLPSVVLHASRDLDCALVKTYNPVAPETPQLFVDVGFEALYRWNEGDGSYDLVTDRLPLNYAEFEEEAATYYREIESSEDCSRVFFRTGYELIAGGSGLYEWEEGTLRDAGVLPSGSPGAGAAVGGEVDPRGTAHWGAASADGKRFFFSAIADEEGPGEGTEVGARAVFMREDVGAEIEVTDISESEGAGVKTRGARFEAASADGSTAFFAANHGLDAEASVVGPTSGDCDGSAFFTSNPPVEEEPCDLYAYDVESGELTDVSADTNEADPIGAAVQGAVAVDADGSHVYFAAAGQLVEGEGRTYAQNTAGEGSANVYLYDGEAEELAYVTTLSRADLAGGTTVNGAVLMRRPQRWSAETSADGSRLLFESRANLTGYDSGGGKQAYLYDAGTGKLTCISCPPRGGPTLTPDNVVLLAGQRGEYPSGRPRALSEDGRRAFFTSADVLAPGGEEGALIGSRFEKASVYQWEEGQVSFLAVVERSGGNGVGRYMDASADGETVFVGTKGRLTPEDQDFVADVYAIKAGGGFPFAPKPPPCQVDDRVALEPNQVYCQDVSSPEPEAASPPTAGFRGSGDVTEAPSGRQRRCGRHARGARALSRRAKALRRQARRAKRGGNRRAARRNTKRARRAARAARRGSQMAKRCRRARAANFDRGGTR